MKSKLAVIAILLSFGSPALAHRLDEYLQATIISLESNRVQLSMRLVPGVAVSSLIVGSIDRDADGMFSAAEQHAYAEHLIDDLALSVDGRVLKPRLLSMEFPKPDELKDGLGEIKIELAAKLTAGGSNRKIVFANRHQSGISAYLVNCLLPRSRDIQVTAQKRNENQSFYEVDYAQSGAQRFFSFHALLGNLGGFPSMFRLGMRHIAEGTDHLLFLLTLLLPAPLLVSRSRWAGFAGVRQSAARILQVVTAFTLGHSLTLALAVFGLVRVPSRPIEILIAVSILVSAAHALRPLFPGREAAIAACFGLLHGLAFAATLQNLGLSRWERVASILGFNLGIETMQLIVVCAVMPSLVLLSRTHAYSLFRVSGGIFAILAGVGWIAERLLDVYNPINAMINAFAHQAVWVAPTLFVISLLAAKAKSLGSNARAISNRA